MIPFVLFGLFSFDETRFWISEPIDLTTRHVMIISKKRIPNFISNSGKEPSVK